MHEVSRDRRLEAVATGQGLLHRKLMAGAPNNVLCGPGFYELETVAERISLANHGQNFHFTEGQRKFQADHFADRNFNSEHGRNTRFADVDCVSSNDRAIARINPDVDLEFEAAVTTGFHHFVSLASFECTIQFQVDRLPDQKTMPGLTSLT